MRKRKSGNGAIGYRRKLPSVEITLPRDTTVLANQVTYENKTNRTVSTPKCPSTSFFEDFFDLTDSRQGFKTKYQNP